MIDENNVMVELHHQSILLTTIIMLMANNETMPDKYFQGYADGIRKNEMSNVPENLRDAVGKRSGDVFEGLSKSTKKGTLQDFLDIFNELRGK